MVALVHAGLLALLVVGWLTAPAYAVAAIALSSTAVGLLARPLSRLLRNLRVVMRQFEAGATDDEAPSAAAPGSSSDLADRLERLHYRTLTRVKKLKTARKAAEHASREKQRIAWHLNRAQRISRVGSWEWERAVNRVVCSAEVYRMLGIDPLEVSLTPSRLIRLVHHDDRRALRRWVIRLARGKTASGLDLRIQGQEGEYLQVRMLGETLVPTHGGASGVVGTIQDASEHARAIHEIHKLAYYDVLTELPNRSRFHEKLAEALDFACRNSKSFAIMFLDLDQFKRINDTLGHAIGDELLRVVAQRLTRVLRLEGGGEPLRGKSPERDVCRQGGDEFVVLLNGVDTEEQAARAARRVVETLAQPVMLAGQEVFVSASIGIVLYPRDGGDLDTLLKNADVAMYHAKSEGRNRYAFYRESMREATARRLSLENELRRAIEAEQFVLHYQPQIDTRTGAIVGVEALVRWNHPTQGFIGPEKFITIAEEAGLIMAIWEWVFVSALIQHNSWIQDGLPPVVIGVNMSSVQFTDIALAARVEEIAEVVGVPLDCIELEVTESALMRDFDGALATLEKLHAMGVKIAIDDFGTGYSSLSYLRRLPLHKLKLDISFVRDAVESAEAAAITRAIIAMANSLNLEIVAEGVETQVQADFLADSGCTTMQGYLLSRPLTAKAMTELLRGGRVSAGGRNGLRELELE